MLTTQWRQRLRRFTAGRPASAQPRRGYRQPLAFTAPAEVLESRELLTGGSPIGTPYLVFAQSPANSIAGHGLSAFTVDVMIQNKGANVPRIDTNYNGIYSVTANGPGVLVTPENSFGIPPNQPLSIFFVGIVNGVGAYLQRFDTASLDVTGTYTLTATGLPDPNSSSPVITIGALSSKFMVTPDTATDHLVFINAGPAIVGFPESVTVEVVDQFGNLDPNVSNVSVTVIAVPGTASTATLENGEATVNGVVFTSAGTDPLIAIGFGGPNGVLVGFTDVTVISLPFNG